ncbi:MAG: M48 family metallopeptidase [Gammaproteobacteria bacterium]
MQRLISLRLVPLGLAATVALAVFSALMPGAAWAKDKIEANGETAYLARNFIFIDSPAIEGYLRGICKRLLDARGSKAEVPNLLIQSSDAFNAFTDSNGNLVISTGALRAMESEDELAALLGHELSHLLLKHPQNKDVLRALPLGMETMASLRDAAAALKGQQTTHPADLAKFDPNSLSDLQATGMLWSDFISPSWNRNQEREADENGFELMRAAGYDPSAFGLLFAKLQAAEAKRSERMQVLKKALVARLSEAAAAQAAASASGTSAQVVAVSNNLKSGLADTASEKLVDGLSAFNRSYESPDERQADLSAYARAHREKQRVPHPDGALNESLKGGEGAVLLNLDTSAIATMDALAARNAATAKKAVQELGNEESKQPSPHLNLAVGSYHQIYGRREIGAAAAQAWLAAAHPPAQSFMWSASYQVQERNYEGALATLEAGRKRVGDSTPFMPTLVAVARASGNLPLARDYARECRAESGRNVGDKLQSLVSQDAAPKGLYAECVRQLGEVPPEDIVAERVADKTRESVLKLFRKR